MLAAFSATLKQEDLPCGPIKTSFSEDFSGFVKAFSMAEVFSSLWETCFLFFGAVFFSGAASLSRQQLQLSFSSIHRWQGPLALAGTDT
jgi:hypothetical protein